MTKATVLLNVKKCLLFFFFHSSILFFFFCFFVPVVGRAKFVDYSNGAVKRELGLAFFFFLSSFLFFFFVVVVIAISCFVVLSDFKKKNSEFELTLCKHLAVFFFFLLSFFFPLSSSSCTKREVFVSL